MDTRRVEYLLSKKYGYKNLPGDLSEKYRGWFRENLPEFLATGELQPLCTVCGTPLWSTFDRIVIGDYGAFIEFSPDQANDAAFIVAPGQEYRINDPKYSCNVKYEWYTVNDRSNVKIYKQKRRVTYADYRPGKYYVSVHEVKPYEA